MLHDAHGFWIADAGNPAVLPPLEGEHTADVVVVGGGYTGMWTAWHLLDADPDARVIVLEGDAHAVTGRAGATAASSPRWTSAPTALRADYGAAGDAWVRAARETVDAIGAWCEAEGVDAHYRRGGELVVSTAPAQDAVSAEADGRRDGDRADGRAGPGALRLARVPRRRVLPERGERASRAARLRAARAAARQGRPALRGVQGAGHRAGARRHRGAHGPRRRARAGRPCSRSTPPPARSRRCATG